VRLKSQGQTGKEHAREYNFREASTNHHVVCGHCGVRLYTYGTIEHDWFNVPAETRHL